MMVKKGQVICVLLGITLAAAVFFVDTLDSSEVSQGRLARNSYGQGEKSEEVVVQGLLEDDIRIDVPVAEREYGEEEAGAAMDRARGKRMSGARHSLTAPAQRGRMIQACLR